MPPRLDTACSRSAATASTQPTSAFQLSRRALSRTAGALPRSEQKLAEETKKKK